MNNTGSPTSDHGLAKRRIQTSHDPMIELDVVEAGRRGDPLVLLCHGFPETAHSWRHQINALAAAGYHVMAPNQRGYGNSTAPAEVDAYRIDHLTADLLALIDDAGAEQAVIVGHDWGAIVTWLMGLLHPGRCAALVAASVPYTAWPARPTDLLRAVYGDNFFYILYFQQVGPAERELDADVAHTMRTVLWGASGEAFAGVMASGSVPDPLPATGTGFLDALVHMAGPAPERLPSWLGEDDLTAYIDSFSASGFFGPVSWYRNLDANYDLTNDLDLARLSMPSYFIGGTHDGVIAGRPEMLIPMETLLPGYRGKTMIEGAGHWTQQERPREFNEALLTFLGSLDRWQ